MACEFRSSLWAHAAGELGQAECEQLAEHLAVCEECSAELRSIQATRELLAIAAEAPPQVDWRRADDQVRTAAASRLAKLDRAPARWVWAVGFAAAAACVAIVCVQAGERSPAQPAVAVAPNPVPPAEPAVVEASEGARLADSADPLAAGAALGAGARLEASKAGRALLKLPDGSRVRLAEESRLLLSSVAREEVRLQVERGRVAVKATHVERKGFVVEAAGATVRVVGTAFSVGLSETEIDVAVAEGKVQVELPGGRTQAVAAGERAVIDRKSGWLVEQGLRESDRQDFSDLDVPVAIPAPARPAAVRPAAPAAMAAAPAPAAAPIPAAPLPAAAVAAPAALQDGPREGGLAPVPIEMQLLRRAEESRASGKCGLFQEMLANYLEEPGADEAREHARWLRASCFAASGLPVEADAEYRRYLREFPEGPHADEARQAVAH